MKDQQVKIEGDIGFETDKAVKLTTETDGREIWVPFSVVHEINRQERYMVVDEWFARKESLT